jgi:serine phosphatase RsbU (regulator of sigma subunit)
MIDVEIVHGGQTHSFHLEDGEHQVGRASNNEVQLPVARVSKQHAIIRVLGERIFVRDLGSSNGTEVNGKPVGEAEVEVAEGSLVSFAGAIMRRAGALSTQAHQLVGERHVTTQLRYNLDQGYSNAARDRIVENSSALFELLASGQDATEVQTAACQFVAQCVTADRVVLLEDEGEATSIDARARWTRSGDSNAPLQLSSTIVNEVVKKRDSVLVANPLDDPRFGGQQSIMALNLRSAMAAPLFDNERVRGILYVDTADARVQYSRADLEVLSAAANAVAVKLRNLSYEREMRTAAKIQRAMLPHHLEAPDGYELEAHQVMCRAVGGDLYHCAKRPNGTVMIALGDVSGKGMPAALAMGAATVLIGMLAEIEGDLETLCGHIHRQLFRSLATEQFVTVFVAELDGPTGVMRYVNAGHEPALLLRANGEIEALESTGLPIAMIEDVMLGHAETRMDPGDLLFIFSDGIPEATTQGDEFLGLDPVKRILKENREEVLTSIRAKIVTTVKEFLAGGPASDDVTLMLLRRNP